MADRGVGDDLLHLYPALHAYARYLTRNTHDAEDLVQEAFVRCLGRRRISEIENLEAFVRRVITNEYLQMMRRTLRLRPSQRVETTFRDELQDVLDDNGLQSLLGVLTPRERVAVVNRYYLDLSEAATATEMGCTVGTVKTLNSRALTKLRKNLSAPIPFRIQPSNDRG